VFDLYLAEMNHRYADRLHEIEHNWALQAALARAQGRLSLWSRSLDRLGRAMVVFGKRLQAQCAREYALAAEEAARSGSSLQPMYTVRDTVRRAH
jgi:hypothetical protein